MKETNTNTELAPVKVGLNYDVRTNTISEDMATMLDKLCSEYEVFNRMAERLTKLGVKSRAKYFSDRAKAINVVLNHYMIGERK
jgi:hypothetical protein